jgi:hypothetical protein
MKFRLFVSVAGLFLSMPIFAPAQAGSWQQYKGSVFSFSYPPTWRVSARADQDVTVSDLANPISVEFAVSYGGAGDPHKMSLNAQKHVMEFAQANNFIAKFESVNGISSGGIRLISHLCSFESGGLHFCAANDSKAINVSTVIEEAPGPRVLLVEMMHRPGLDEKVINVGRQIVQTMRLAR